MQIEVEIENIDEVTKNKPMVFVNITHKQEMA